MKKKVRILLVEDEFVTLDILRDYLEEMGYDIVGDAMSADEAMQILAKESVDIAILDIHLKGDKNGIWLAEQIRQLYKFPFIFLSAFSDAATIESASETRPAGYLVKPFTQADIYAAIEVALKNHSNQMGELRLPNSLQSIDSELFINDAIFIKEGAVYNKIVLNDITHIQAFKNYLELNGKSHRHIIRSTLADFQRILPTDYFVQTHRSFVINLSYLDKIGGDFAQVNGVNIPISRSFKNDLLQKLKFYY
jgi:DNA-binding LytR/AlgR family response regulator